MNLDERDLQAPEPTIGVFLKCGHPLGCLGMAADGEGCGWCADAEDVGMLMSNLVQAYGYMTHGRVTQPNVDAKYVIKLHEEFLRQYDEAQEKAKSGLIIPVRR